nr:hypothetical protein [Tanacetum cinerariifolium]
ASLLHKPCVTGSGTKLLTNEKADFLNEIPSNASQATSVAETKEEQWTLFTDGSSCADGLKQRSRIRSTDRRFADSDVNREEEGPTWMTELVNYLKEGTLPADEKKARKIHLKARQSLSGRAGESQVPDRRNGLLHEMDRSKSGSNDYRRTSEEICMGQYCMPLR